MSTVDHTDTVAGNCSTGQHARNDEINPARSLSLNLYEPADPNSDFVNADINHGDANSVVTSASHIASPNQQLGGNLGAAATQDQYIPLWQPNLSPSNHGSRQQAVSTAYDGCNNGWNRYVSITPPAWDPAPQGFAQSLSPATPGFGQRFLPSLSSVDYPLVHSNAIANDYLNPNLQLPEPCVYNDFGATLDSFTSSNLIAQWDDSTEMDPQATMTSFGGSPFVTTTSILAAPSPLVHSNAIANDYLDSTLQLPEPCVYNDFGATLDAFTSINSFAQWGDSTAIDPQATVASIHDLSFSTATTSMPAAPVLHTAASGITAPAVLGPIARSVASQRSNVNTNSYTCDECGTPVARQRDLIRHKRKHGVPQHPCPVEGCRRGSHGFSRADKLREHQRKKHRMLI